MAKNLRSDRVLHLDLELTCWEGEPPAGETSEIIQVGIVEVNTLDLRLSRKESFFVRSANTKVSEYCTNLTGITQRQVDRQGRAIYEVLNTIKNKYGSTRKVCYAWGDDEAAIDRVCRTFPSPLNMQDLGHNFKAMMGLEHGISLTNAIAMLGGAFEGRAHDALVDAENLARLHIMMMLRMRGLNLAANPIGSMSTIL